MSETLGSLCDKLTIVKLKKFHTDDVARLGDLARQEKQLQDEINEFVVAAVEGHTPVDRLSFASHKVYKQEGNSVPDVAGSMGAIVSRLAQVNCELWHVQEHVYAFEEVPPDEKDGIVKQLAILNLERNACIDQIDIQFQAIIKTNLSDV